MENQKYAIIKIVKLLIKTSFGKDIFFCLKKGSFLLLTVRLELA
jgi:hypothetical protein